MSNTNDKFHLDIDWSRLTDGFIQVPNEILAIAKYNGKKFSADHKLIYTYLATLDHRGLLNSKTTKGMQSYDAIMHKFGIASKATLSGKLQTLQDMNLIVKEEQDNGTVNHYTVFPIDLALTGYPSGSHMADSYKNRRKADVGQKIGITDAEIAREERFIGALQHQGNDHQIPQVEQRIEEMKVKRKELGQEYHNIVTDKTDTPKPKPFSKKAAQAHEEVFEPDFDVEEVPEQVEVTSEQMEVETAPEDKPTLETLLVESGYAPFTRSGTLKPEFEEYDRKEVIRVNSEIKPEPTCTDCKSPLLNDGTCSGKNDPDCGKMAADELELPF